MDEKSKGFFWPGYVDLLTALFAVMLVLFVLSFKLFKEWQEKLNRQKEQYKVQAEKYEKLQAIEKQIEALESGGVFSYDSVYNRFLVKEFIGEEIFEPEKFIIKDIYMPTALKAGNEIRELLNKFVTNKNVSFVVLVEGNTALRFDGTSKGSIDGNYELSYKRSLALSNFWKANGIVFPDNTELIIAGSGIYGVGRDPKPENNKRFIIQVIPKTKK